MAIAFVAAATANVGSGTSITVNVPAGTLENHVMVFFCWKQDTDGINMPGAFTEPGAAFNSSASGVIREGTWGYKVASGSEPASYTFTWSTNEQAAGIIATFSGVDTTTPLDVTPTSSHTGVGENNAQPSNQSITTATNGAEVIVLHGASSNDIDTPAAPTGYTLHANTNGNFNRNIFLASKNIASADVESPGAWGHIDDGTVVTDYIVWSLALKPSGGGAAANPKGPFSLPFAGPLKGAFGMMFKKPADKNIYIPSFKDSFKYAA